MIQTSIAHFDIGYTQYLDPLGQPIGKMPAFTENHALLIDLYQWMNKTRVFDTKAITLQRTGKLGTYPSVLGQEAVSIGVGAAMQATDILCPYYRDIGAQFWRGVKMVEILLYWGGDERGSAFTNASVKNDFPICVPIASQTLHAVGIATAIQLKQESKVAVTTLGDGGTSRGDFYEALNLSGVWQLPIVFVINNNQWAISVPREQQTHAKTLAQKGIAAGIRCEQVDGNDVIAVYDRVHTAIEEARLGKGPTLIEAVSYRMGDHTTADDAKRYRSETELEANRLKDPIKRLNRYLVQQGLWDEQKEQIMQKNLIDEVTASVAEYVNTPPYPVLEMFDYLYETAPEALLLQRREAEQWFGDLKNG